MPFGDAQDYEATLFGLVSTTEDMREGTRRSSKSAKPSSKAADASHMRIAIVVSQYHGFITDAARSRRARACCANRACPTSRVETFPVPGAFELAQAAQRVAESGAVGGGRVPRLPDPRRDAALRLHRAARRRTASCARRRTTGVPIAFGVLTTNTAEEALARAGDGPGEQGPRSGLGGASAMAAAVRSGSTRRGRRPIAPGRDHDASRRRHQAREAALQILYFWEVGQAEPAQALDAYFARAPA